MPKVQSEPQIATYLHSKGIRMGLPISGNFELTARCNFNCPMCYVHMSKEEVEEAGKELTAAQWISFAEQAKDMGMVFVLLTGGEPLVREDFFEIYHAIRNMGMLVTINSNGSMLKGKVLEQLLENPPARMNISLYGGDNDTYQRMCGNQAYEQVVENIRAVKSQGIDVRLNLSVTPYNKNDIGEIYRKSRELGIHVKTSCYMYPPVRLGEAYGCGNRLSPEEAAAYKVAWDMMSLGREEFERRACNMKKLLAVEKEECIVDEESGIRCRAGRSSFWMTWDGQMRPCGMMPGPTTRPLEMGFAEAWKKLREESAKLRSPSECLNCEKRSFCGVCASVCVTETGEFDKVPSYMCSYTEEILRQSWKMCYNKKDDNTD